LPPQTVFALFDSAAGAEDAVQRLRKMAIPGDHLQVLTGDEGAQILEPDGERTGGVKGVISAVVKEITDETTTLDAYRREMRAGRCLLAVRFDAEDKSKAEDKRTTIEAVLLDSGGSQMSYTSNWTLTKVVDRNRTI
jgi:hypothetical protein